VHQFSTEGAAAGFSLLEISISSSLVLIVIMLLGALFIYQRIARSMQHLLTAAQLTDRAIVNENDAVADKEFIEIDNIAVTLRNALEDLEAKNEQERLFIQTLSHELRTPMAIVQVALELLAKKELADNVREKLEIIFNSNQQMQQLSNDLLSLWSSTEERNVS
jgi:signal transduction histidine kinase